MSAIKEKLKLLNKLVGHWNTTGTILATEDSAGLKIAGTDTYTWLPGEFFLLHTADVKMGEERSQTHEIIGYDKTHDNFSMQYFDNKGASGTMKAEIVGNSWTFSGDNLKFTGGFSEDNNMFKGKWLRSGKDNRWEHFMNITLERAGVV